MGKQLKVVVLAKQVPDTRNVGKDAMKADGTVNRAALPAIFNPEDLNALEQALTIKDMCEGSTVYILTMGPLRAADIIRDAMFRGADGGYLLTDRAFAGADTLATSYALSRALAEIKPDIIVAGRQAIDGDTAQVGPGIARRMGLNQLTYVSAIDSLDMGRRSIVVRRRSEGGVQVLRSALPCLITMLEDSNVVRRGSIHDMLRAARAPVTIWSAEDAGVEDPLKCGLRGSPTVVKRVFAPSPREESAEMVTVEGKDPAKIGDAIIDLIFARDPKLELALSATRS